MKKQQRALLVASVAGILAALGAGSAAHAVEGENSGTGHCYGVNKCKGTGDCGGKGHSCHGQNACKAQGYIDMDTDDCLRIDGGRLTETPEAS